MKEITAAESLAFAAAAVSAEEKGADGIRGLWAAARKGVLQALLRRQAALTMTRKILAFLDWDYGR